MNRRWIGRSAARSYSTASSPSRFSRGSYAAAGVAAELRRNEKEPRYGALVDGSRTAWCPGCGFLGPWRAHAGDAPARDG